MKFGGEVAVHYSQILIFINHNQDIDFFSGERGEREKDARTKYIRERKKRRLWETATVLQFQPDFRTHIRFKTFLNPAHYDNQSSSLKNP